MGDVLGEVFLSESGGKYLRGILPSCEVKQSLRMIFI
jgi:hypothetical protein